MTLMVVVRPGTCREFARMTYTEAIDALQNAPEVCYLLRGACPI